MLFTGARNANTALMAGDYAYAATPELDIEHIKDAQVTFWGTCDKYVGNDYESGLIVGVMDNPEDFLTFVSVDTVHISKINTFDRFTVCLDSYKGEGKYVAFASNFKEKSNIFFLDEVEVALTPSARTITDVQISELHANSFTINVNLHGNSQVELYLVRAR